MKRLSKHMAIIVPIVLVIFFLSFAYENKTRISYEEQPLVFVTKTGDRYHSYGCHYLRISQIPKGIYQAEREGYRCCLVCGGVANGAIRVERTEVCVAAIPVSIARGVLLAPLIYAPIWKLFAKKDDHQGQ